MPDPHPMFRNGEFQDSKGWLKKKNELNGVKWDTAASGCALRPPRSSGSCFWGCGVLPEILWGKSGWQLLWTGRARGIMDSWQALAASHELCQLLLMKACIKVLDWADSWQSKGKNPLSSYEGKAYIKIHLGAHNSIHLVFHRASNGHCLLCKLKYFSPFLAFTMTYENCLQNISFS